MFGMFKKKAGKQGADSTIDSKELLGGEESTDSGRDVKTTLSFPENVPVTEEERYYYQFLNNELPPLKENQISLSGVELKVENGDVYVTAFVRNSLSSGIQFEQETNLLLLGPNEELIARKAFNLSGLGEIPAESSRPWMFIFEKNFVQAAEIPQTDWKLAFELKKAHALDLEETWEKSISADTKAQLEKLISEVEPPKLGEVNFMGIQASQNEEGALHITLLIRNGSEQNIQLQQLPLAVEDASHDVIAKGGFQLNNLEVKANTSKPWTFIFPKENVLKQEMDLSRWKAYPPNEE